MDGVQEASVNLVNEQAQVTYDPSAVKLSEMFAAINKAGYQAEALKAETIEEKKESNAPMIIMLVLGAILLYIGMSHMLPFPLPLPDIIDDQTHPFNFAMIQLILDHDPADHGQGFLCARHPCALASGAQYGYAGVHRHAERLSVFGVFHDPDRHGKCACRACALF